MLKRILVITRPILNPLHLVEEDWDSDDSILDWLLCESFRLSFGVGQDHTKQLLDAKKRNILKICQRRTAYLPIGGL